jgi:MFS family permease
MSASVASAGMPRGSVRELTPDEVRRVIFASSLGTVFEWYDFYLYGSLAAVISKQFFSGVNPTAGFIFALLAFAAGFAVRPFGAIFFGRLGDLVGRKYTFLITIVIMGLSTFIVGVLPNYATIGVAAPVILILLRLLQGLALGGEYGGAATYVAEHSPRGKRGAYTSWIQTTATLGLFLSLLVILGCRIWLKLNESPLFQQMKAEGKGSKHPLKDSFGRWENLKVVLLALFGLTAGQAVVWYAGQFYSLFFLTQILKVDANTANVLIAVALLLGTPFFLIFGSLSDRIGRKPIIMGGLLLAAVTYFPIFKAITHYANPALEAAENTAPVVVVADPVNCSVQFNPVGTSKFTSPCDVAKSALVRKGVPYANEAGPSGRDAQIRVGTTVIPSYDATGPDAKAQGAAFDKSLGDALGAAKYPAKADSAAINKPMLTFLLWILVIYVTMVYGPIAAMLVELFPTRIRYTSMSLPYHIGNGWFGGFLPPIAFAIVAKTGNIYSGLWYPVIIALITLVIGTLFVKETKNVNIESDTLAQH